jgi:hypothetical protein
MNQQQRAVVQLAEASGLALEVLQKHLQMKGDAPMGALGHRAIEELERARDAFFALEQPEPEPVQEPVADGLIRSYVDSLVANKPDEAAEVTKRMVDYVFATPPAQPEPVQEPDSECNPYDLCAGCRCKFSTDYEPPAQPEPDMYWDDDDSERPASDSIHELLYERWNNGDLEVGYEVSMTCAKQMEPLTVRVTKLDEDADEIEYEVVKKGTP